MITRNELQQALSGGTQRLRLTQGSPIRPDVWYEYVKGRGGKTEVLLIPYRGKLPSFVFRGLHRRECPVEAFNESVVLADLGFDEMLEYVLPLTSWWQRNGGWICKDAREVLEGDRDDATLPTDALTFLKSVGLVLALASARAKRPPDVEEVAKLAAKPQGLLKRAVPVLEDLPGPGKGMAKSLFAVSVNRRAEVSSRDSEKTIKADAAKRLFRLRFSHLRWAVLDTGIDVMHSAFGSVGPDGEPEDRCRVEETYDFTRLSRIMALATSPDEAARDELRDEYGLRASDAREISRSILKGRSVDWDLLARAMRVEEPAIDRPGHPHGSHVAGILGGCGHVAPPSKEYRDDPSAGVCPDINLLDLRVLNDEGIGDEFSIIAALQFIRHRNGSGDRPVIQGANLSLQLKHDVTEYACGRTPVCDECDRLVASGVVVVAAAGNHGFGETGAPVGIAQGRFGDVVGGYEGTSITDPGNAEAVITVGATHRSKPHTYGVSFFSSRGPTGDGRQKPDLLAPGERILGPVLDGLYDSMDGTSQAAPHVSGAAAMLMARNAELIGQPQRIKEILCETATDLGRQRDFQGRGLLDTLRALQYV